MFKILFGVVVGVMLIMFYPQIRNITNNISFDDYQITVPIPTFKEKQ